MAKEIKRMSITEFRELGFLQEANRLFFHPLGLALETVTKDDENPDHIECLGGIQDSRTDSEGTGYFDLSDEESKRKADFVEQLRQSKIKAREEVFGSIVQRIGHKF